MPLHQRFGVTATARASFYFYNTLAEVDKLGEALAAAKRAPSRLSFLPHNPKSLPAFDRGHAL